MTKDDLDLFDHLGGVPSIRGLDQKGEEQNREKSNRLIYVALVSEIFFVSTLDHLLQHLVVDVTQLERRSLRVESSPIKDVRESAIVNVNRSSRKRFSTIRLLFVLSPLGRVPDVLSSFRDRRTHSGMVRVPEIHTLIAKRFMSDEGVDECGAKSTPTSVHWHLFEGHTRT